MVHSPLWDSDNPSAAQGIVRVFAFLCILRVRYTVHKSLSQDPAGLCLLWQFLIFISRTRGEAAEGRGKAEEKNEEEKMYKKEK
jgi:hypothetical protein